MITRLSKEEINSRIQSEMYHEYDFMSDIDEYVQISQVEESGLSLLDENDNVVSMYKADNLDEADLTMKKVVSVLYLGEDDITKVEKIKHIIKGVLEICFRKKISVAILSSMFIFMIGLGIKEKFYPLIPIYLWGLCKITNAADAVKFLKSSIKEFKLRDEALGDKEFMDFYKSSVTDDVEDVKLYLKLKK